MSRTGIARGSTVPEARLEDGRQAGSRQPAAWPYVAAVALLAAFERPAGLRLFAGLARAHGRRRGALDLAAARRRRARPGSGQAGSPGDAKL